MHIFRKGQYCLEKFPVVLWARFYSADWSEAGTDDLKTANKSLGISSIVRTGAGVFKVTLLEAYHSVLSVQATGAGVTSVYVNDDDVDGATPYFEITLNADPTDQAYVLLEVKLRNSSLG